MKQVLLIFNKAHYMTKLQTLNYYRAYRAYKLEDNSLLLSFKRLRNFDASEVQEKYKMQ